jgi:tRNA dimethylallyltransferase
LKPLIAIVGPTGSGKSELALRVAEAFGGEIINCDSLQAYRYFDIGTAKPSAPQRQRIPHHLIDILDPDQSFSAGEYARAARRVLAGIGERRRLAVLAGGTGFYLRALLEGLFHGPGQDAALRARLAQRHQRRPGSLHRLLRRFDPETARRIHPNDVPKLIRALEICLVARQPAAALFRQGREALEGYRTLKLGLWPDREPLYAHLDSRCEQMFAAGLVEETSQILARGFPPKSKPFESHGYRQAMQLLAGELNAKDALFYAQRNTRRYAKRQMTWFRRETEVEWLHGFGDDADLQADALSRIERFLTSF